MRSKERVVVPESVDILYYEGLRGDSIFPIPASIFYCANHELLKVELRSRKECEVLAVLISALVENNQQLGKEFREIYRKNIFAPDTVRTKDDWALMINPDNWRIDTLMTDSQLAVILKYPDNKDTLFLSYLYPGNLEYHKKGYVDTLLFSYIANKVFQSDSAFGHVHSDTLFCLRSPNRKNNVRQVEQLYKKAKYNKVIP